MVGQREFQASALLTEVVVQPSASGLFLLRVSYEEELVVWVVAEKQQL